MKKCLQAWLSCFLKQVMSLCFKALRRVRDSGPRSKKLYCWFRGRGFSGFLVVGNNAETRA